MHAKHRHLGGLGGFALALLACGCGQDTDHLAQMGRLTSTKLGKLAEAPWHKLQLGLEALGSSLENGAVESRVSSRLRWDKALEGVHIEVTSPSPGVVRLEGTGTEAQKTRAAELANATQGVTSVVNEIKLPAAP